MTRAVGGKAKRLKRKARLDRDPLRHLHNRRHWLLTQRQLGLPGWSQEEYDRVLAGIDILEKDVLPLGWWRNQLLFRLKDRHFDLVLAHAKELLSKYEQT